MSQLVYLYGFVPDELRSPPQLTGIDDAAVELLPLAGFAAVISRVPASDYDAEAIEHRLQDLKWVAARGIEHERVVAWCVDQAQIIPASLLTLYSSVDALKHSAEAQHHIITNELQRLRQVREWDLKISYDARRLAENSARFSSALQQIEGEIANAPPGRKYLLERKRGEITKSEVARVAAAEAQNILERARALSAEVITLPIPPTREQLPVVLHAALLVDRSREAQLIERLEDTVNEYTDTGIEVSFSGPWAPYRFVRHERT